MTCAKTVYKVIKSKGVTAGEVRLGELNIAPLVVALLAFNKFYIYFSIYVILVIHDLH